MRKDTSAGIIAGAISSIPVGLGVPIAFLFFLWRHFPQTIHPSNPAEFTIFFDAFITVPALAITACLGAIAGFTYAKLSRVKRLKILLRPFDNKRPTSALLRKLPVHSTYLKAVTLSVSIWIILTLILRPNSEAFLRFFRYYIMVLALLVFDAIIFSYLFDRWT